MKIKKQKPAHHKYNRDVTIQNGVTKGQTKIKNNRKEKTMSNILEIKGLYVDSADGEKEILKGVNLEVGADETHVLMGPNGTGKSTLGYAITGNPGYEVKSGQIIFDGEKKKKKKRYFLIFPEST